MEIKLRSNGKLIRASMRLRVLCFLYLAIPTWVSAEIIEPNPCTPIVEAVKNNNKEAIDYQLAHSSGTECLGDALVESIRAKNPDLTNRLLQRGASTNFIENESHGTACVKATPLSAAVLVKDRRLIERLVSKGADPNLPDCGDVGDPSAFDAAVGQNDRDVVRYFLSHKADAQYSLQYASSVEMAKLLLAHGADLDYAAKGDTFTALMLAAGNGQKDLVQFLISKGANVNWKTDDPFPPGSPPPTALRMARENHHDDIAALLKKAGAKE